MYMTTMRMIVKNALAQYQGLTNRDLRNIVAKTLGRPILYNLSGSMIKQERQKINNNILIFVYGTLMKGFGNNEHVLYDSTFVKATKITGFEMFTNGAFPMLLESSTDKIIYGELWLINSSAFRRCDGLEGYPSHYNRKQIQTENGLAWVYFYNTNSFANRQHYLIKIDDGNFRQWKLKSNAHSSAGFSNHSNIETSVVNSVTS